MISAPPFSVLKGLRWRSAGLRVPCGLECGAGSRAPAALLGGHAAFRSRCDRTAGWMQALARRSPVTYALRGIRAALLDDAGMRKSWGRFRRCRSSGRFWCRSGSSCSAPAKPSPRRPGGSNAADSTLMIESNGWSLCDFFRYAQKSGQVRRSTRSIPLISGMPFHLFA
jgi:hypothetical protein